MAGRYYEIHHISEDHENRKNKNYTISKLDDLSNKIHGPIKIFLESQHQWRRNHHNC